MGSLKHPWLRIARLARDLDYKPGIKVKEQFIIGGDVAGLFN